MQAGVWIAKGFLRWLVAFLIPSREDLLKAGVYLDERYDRLIGGEELVYEEMRRNNDEGSDLLPAKRHSSPDGRVNEERKYRFNPGH